LSKYAATAEAEKRTVLSGKDIWRLYDTYGFPVDLTQIMAEERGLQIDGLAFEKARLESLEASKAGGKDKGGAGVKLDVHDLAALEANPEVPKTNDSFKYRESFHRRSQLCADHIQNSMKSKRRSKAYFIPPDSSNPPPSSLRTQYSVSCWTGPTSMRNKEDKRMILAFSQWTGRPISRWKMCRCTMDMYCISGRWRKGS